MRAYTVHYLLDGVFSEEKSVSLLARNKLDAYSKAVFEIIPKTENRPPYYAYVYSVTYQNGNQKIFNIGYGYR